jgi:hypothetical protein
MSRPAIVNKVALVPLSKLQNLRKREASSAFANDADTGSSTSIGLVSDNKQQKISDVNLQKSLNLKEVMLNVANDNSLGDDEKLQKYLSALRHYVIFRDKSRLSQQQPIPVKLMSEVPINDNVKEISVFPMQNESVSPTRLLSRGDSSNIETGLKGVQKKRALELLEELKENPGFTWNDNGNISIGEKHFPESNINDLIRYEIIKYTQKGRQEIPPRNYTSFFSFMKSQNISPHKTSRGTRQIDVVDFSTPSGSKSIQKKLKFEDSSESEQKLIGEGFASHHWDTY